MNFAKITKYMTSRCRYVVRVATQGTQSRRKTARNLAKNRHLSDRMLEIGPGKERLPGFETLNVVDNEQTDYVADAAVKLPFEDDTFSVVFASHVLEHMPWYRTQGVLAEWVRVLEPGGRLEIWVPDALKVCQTVVAAEGAALECLPDDWRAKNPAGDPYIWAAGRLFWGGNPTYPSWHHAMFTPRYLQQCLTAAGLNDVRPLDSGERRGIDHGWINLGMVGTK